MKKKYRIMTDAYAGYEVQVWRWWLPIWIECRFANTHSSIDEAKKWIEDECRSERDIRKEVYRT